MIKPQKGHTVIRSTTLSQAFHTIIALVAQYTTDPHTGERKGLTLLTEGGLFSKLQSQLLSRECKNRILCDLLRIILNQSHIVIHDHRLDRVARTKLYYGREHLQILFSCMLMATLSSGPNRATVLQSMAIISLPFYASCRPSSLGYTEKEWRDHGLVGELVYFVYCFLTSPLKYPKLKNVRIFRRNDMEYEIQLDLQQFKVNEIVL